MSYVPKIYRKPGGDEMVVASGGVITVESGGEIELQTGAILQVNASNLDVAELAYLDGLTVGVVVASKAVVVDANKDIGDFRNLDAVNIDAGSSGAAGSVDVFPATASRGKLSVTVANQTGDTTVTLNANAMGQATQINLSDPGAAASYMAQSTAALTLAEVDVLDAVTPGTVAASKAVVVDANKDAGDFRNLDAVNLDAGASAVAGSVDVFPTTASKGKLTISCDDQTGNTTVTLKPNLMGQATTVNIPDPGAAASYVAQSTAALTLAEVDVLDAVTPGVAAVSKAVVLGATHKNIDEVHTAALYLGADAGTLVTATAANLNAVPTATGTGLEIDEMTKNVASSASTITLGAGGAPTQAAAIQLKDADANGVGAGQMIEVYVSDDSVGLTPASATVNGAVTVSVGATLKVDTAKLHWRLVTDATGAVTLTFDNTGGGGAYTKYVVLVLPNRKLKVSAALNVATA